MRAERDGEDGDERWALHASDRALLGNKTGVTRLGFAILLKMFRKRGKSPGTPAFFPCADSTPWTLCIMCCRPPPFPR
jgi:hypothetical protein